MEQACFCNEELGLSIEKPRMRSSNNAGLKGIAGIGTEDFREILAAADEGNKRARMAVEQYIDGIRKYIGSYSAIMGGVDCICTQRRHREKNPYMRERM